MKHGFDDRCDETADVRRVLRLEVQVVDEDQQDTATRIPDLTSWR